LGSRHFTAPGRQDRRFVDRVPDHRSVAEDFQKAKKNAIKVTVGISGTGGGFKKFCRGETDISNASRPILKRKWKTARQAGVEYIELPVAFDALTVVINPKNTFLKPSPWPN
jgi:phosphate transport system substrate-binding protein